MIAAMCGIRNRCADRDGRYTITLNATVFECKYKFPGQLSSPRNSTDIPNGNLHGNSDRTFCLCSDVLTRPAVKPNIVSSVGSKCRICTYLNSRALPVYTPIAAKCTPTYCAPGVLVVKRIIYPRAIWI